MAAPFRFDPSEFEISDTSIDADLARLASQAFRYGAKLDEAKLDLSNAELVLDVTKATADQRIRQDALTANEKITEAIVTARVATDTSVMAAANKVIACQHTVNTFKTVMEALRFKKDALITICANKRQEIDSDISFSHAERESVKRHVQAAMAEVKKGKR